MGRSTIKVRPTDIGATEAGTDIWCETTVIAEIHIGVGQQLQRIKAGFLNRCTVIGTGKRAAVITSRCGVEVGFKHVFAGQTDAEIFVDLITDTNTDIEGIVNFLGCILQVTTAPGIAVGGIINFVEIIRDVAA